MQGDANALSETAQALEDGANVKVTNTKKIYLSSTLSSFTFSCTSSVLLILFLQTQTGDKVLEYKKQRWSFYFKQASSTNVSTKKHRIKVATLLFVKRFWLYTGEASRVSLQAVSRRFLNHNIGWIEPEDWIPNPLKAEQEHQDGFTFT